MIQIPDLIRSGLAWENTPDLPGTKWEPEPVRMPVVSYAVQGSTVLRPAASNGAVSRVATIMPLAAAVAAM